MRRHGLLSIAIALVLLFGVGEAVARTIDANLVPDLVYYSEEADIRVAQMDALADGGGVHLVMVGTSVAWDLDPAALPASVDDRPVGYNAALGSGIPLLNEHWTLRTVLPRLQPDLLLIGLTSYDVFDTEAAVAYRDLFLASKGAQRDLGDADPLDRIDEWLTSHSSLWSHRTSLRNPTGVIDAMRERPPLRDPMAASVQPTGRPSLAQEVQFEDRQFDGGADLTGWSIGTENVGALRRLIREATAQGVTVVLVNLPTTAEYIARHPRGADDFQAYVDYLVTFASDEDVDLIDLSELSDHLWYRDHVHMNLIGTQVFTERLVEELRARGLDDGVFAG